MDLAALRGLVLDVAQASFGVPATVTRPAPDNTPVPTTGIWTAMPLEEPRPVGTDFQRREPRRILTLPRDVLPTLPRGTTIVAPERQGEVDKTWKVEGFAPTEATDIWRAVVALAMN